MTEFDLNDFLPYRLNRASEWIGNNFSQTYQQKYQMSRWEWRTLANLGQHGKLTAKQVTRYGNMDKTKVSRAVAGLEKRSWIVRETDTGDARLEWLSLTDKGRTIFNELARDGLYFDAKLSAELGEAQLRSLKEGLGALERLLLKK